MAPIRHLAIACAMENDLVYKWRVARLVVSIRELGGACSDAPIIVYAIDRISSSYREWLKHWEVEVREVRAPLPGHPHTNKLAMLINHNADQDLLALDCDTAVIGDVRRLIPSRCHVAARPADYDFVGDEGWSEIADHFGVVIERTIAPKSVVKGGRPSVRPYYNSGVVYIPKRSLAPLASLWHGWCLKLSNYVTTTADPPRWAVFIDQVALALSLQHPEMTPRIPEPPFNFPTHIAVPQSIIHEVDAPAILHYHDAVDGTILKDRDGSPAFSAMVNELQRVWEQHLSATSGPI